MAGDIAIDILKAADPVATAKAALSSRSGEAARKSVPAADFSREIGAAASIGRPKPDSKADAFKQFEAMVLQTFVRSMLPEGTESVYGEGLSGEMWKGLMAEKLASAIAERGGIGIAKTLLKDHVMENERVVPLRGVDRSDGMAAIDEQTLLSTALIEQIQRSLLGAETNDETRDAQSLRTL